MLPHAGGVVFQDDENRHLYFSPADDWPGYFDSEAWQQAWASWQAAMRKPETVKSFAEFLEDCLGCVPPEMAHLI